MKEFNLKFEGYWRQERISGMPTYDGIYCVYVGTPQSDGTVNLRKLIYIGKADRDDGVRGRLSTHEKMPDFEKKHVLESWYTFPVLRSRILMGAIFQPRIY